MGRRTPSHKYLIRVDRLRDEKETCLDGERYKHYATNRVFCPVCQIKLPRYYWRPK